MRFARHARIYRGPLDAAPLAGVAFLLILFLLLTSLVYTPGALVRLADGAVPPANSERLELTRAGSLIFRGVTYKNLADAKSALQQAPIHRLSLVVDPGADAALARAVNSWFDVNLPTAQQLTGVDNPGLVVAVNFRGQTFFGNQLMDEAELKAALKTRLQDARRRGSDLTLTLIADQDTTLQTLMRLSDSARTIGFKEVVFGVKP